MPPLISAILPTTDQRLKFLPLAIDCLRQQRMSKEIELVIVSEHERARAVAMREAAHAGLHARAFCAPHKITIGTKRNLACAETLGEWITFWDDDDWSHPDRLRLTAERCRGDVQLVGSQTMLIHELTDPRRRTFRYQYAPTDATYPPRFFVGGTLTFRRSLWAQHPFDDAATGEEAWWQMQVGDVPATELPDDRALYVAMIHGTNTGNRQVPSGDPTWHPWDGDLNALLGRALRGYESAATSL